MSEEPPAKRLKLSSEGPLTRSDIILFQKDALFRHMNSYRHQLQELSGRFNTLEEELSTATKACSESESRLQTVVEKLGLTLDADIDTILSAINSGAAGENDVLAKYQKCKQELLGITKERDSLTKQLAQTREYYEKVFKKFDRDDSEVVQRVNAETAKEEEPAVVDKEGTVEPVENSAGSEALVEEIAQLKITIEHLQQELAVKAGKIEELGKQQQPVMVDTTQLVVLEEKNVLLTHKVEELEKTNNQYAEQVTKLVHKDESMAAKYEKQYQDALNVKNAGIVQLEQDLVRIRTARDDLISRVSILEGERSVFDMITDMQKTLDAQADWISKHKNPLVEGESGALVQELKEMETAFKEMQALATRKYESAKDVAKMNGEKTRADQKYFAAMRAKDALAGENRALHHQVMKLNEALIASKEHQRLLETQTSNLTKLQDAQALNAAKLTKERERLSGQVSGLNSELRALKKMDAELKAKQAQHTSELQSVQDTLSKKLLECKQMQQQLTSAKTKLDRVAKGGRSALDEDAMTQMRQIVYCSLCNNNWKNTCITTCGHVFCKDCVDQRVASRMRKCPGCQKPFGSGDVLAIHL